MTRFWPIVLIVLLPGPELLAQSKSPEEALAEFATTENPQVFERYLPSSVQQALDQLSPADRQQTLKKFLVSKMAEKDGVKIRPTDDPRTLQLVRDEHPPATISLRNRFIDGADALLILELKDDRSSQLLLVRLHLEDDDWRVEEFGPWDSRSLESDDLLEQIVPARHNEVSAVSLLHLFNNATANYSRMFPAAGWPSSLRALSGSAGDQRSPEHALILDASLVPDPGTDLLVKDGYAFRYVKTGMSHFQITASPVEYGKTGSRSFFMDDSGVIRFTTEDRPANERDEPLR